MPVKHLPQHVSESVKRLNPHLFGDGMGRLETSQPESTAAPALEGGASKLPERKRSVGVRIMLLAFRKRLLDDDNNVASFKPLKDAVAAELGVDDADHRLKWEYQQVKTEGNEGVIVQITLSP